MLCVVSCYTMSICCLDTHCVLYGPTPTPPALHLPPSAALPLLYKYLRAISVRAPAHRTPGEVLGLVVKNFASGSNDVCERTAAHIWASCRVTLQDNSMATLLFLPVHAHTHTQTQSYLSAPVIDVMRSRASELQRFR